jgi:hypothetical protein
MLLVYSSILIFSTSALFGDVVFISPLKKSKISASASMRAMTD